MPIKIAINGFGRIGRAAFKAIAENKDLKVVCINDLADKETLIHLLKHDSVYGEYKGKIAARFVSEKDPLKLPWKGIDVVLECTGVFADLKAKKHLKAGAKKVIISAPAKEASIPTYLLGANEEEYKGENLISMGSCTTNCLAPIAKVLDETFGIEKGFLTTIHSYTTTQNILDAPHKDLRRARAAALNIVPTTTGATKTVEKVLPNLKGKLSGLALRVPTPVVSIVDFVCKLKKETTAQKLNKVLAKKGIIFVSFEPLVSADFIGSPYSAVVDANLTQVQGKMAKILAWYDNEYAYGLRLAEMAQYIKCF